MSAHAAKPGKDADIERRFRSKNKRIRRRGYEMTVDRYGEPIRWYILARFEEFAVWLNPEDVRQETFAALIEIVEDGRYTSTGNMRPLLFEIARRRVGNTRRCKRREGIDGNTDVSALKLAMVEYDDDSDARPALAQDILDAIDSLPPKKRRAFKAWLKLFKAAGRAPSKRKLAREVCGDKATDEQIEAQMDAIRKASDRGRERVREYLESLRHWP